MVKLFVILAISMGLGVLSAQACSLETVVSLKGTWKFTIGDNMKYAQSTYNDSDWDNIYAPDNWENQGYMGYDGFAWYRKTVTIPSTPHNDALYIDLGYIDDVNEVYFNGTKIGELGILPPKYESAYTSPLFYYIPEKLINFNGKNTIAIRVYDEIANGGIINGKLQIGYDKNLDLLDFDLSGNWKLTFHNYKDCRNIGYDDSGWYNVHVPASWESQGFNNYDGHAWYRKEFVLPEKLDDQKLYLILGKIDDKDRVFVNGEEIANYKDMFNTPFDCRYKGYWQMRRAYKIPRNILKPGTKNAIAVLVYDSGGAGGIYEGPVGLMESKHYSKYINDNEEDNYTTILNWIID